MEPTEQEIGWARAIKEAVEKDDNLQPLTDYEYIQHAIVAKEKVHKALTRIQRMQTFRKTYAIPGEGTVEDATQRLENVCRLHQGLFLSMGQDTKGRTVWTGDFSKFHAKSLKTGQDWKDMMGSFYYIFQAMQHNVSSVRNGVVWVAHTHRVGWNNFSLELEKRAASFYSHCYPFRIQQMTMLDPPRVVHLMYALVKIFLSKKVQSVMVLTTLPQYQKTTLHPDTCPQHILPPSMGGTFPENDFVGTIQKRLTERLENSAQYQLPL